MGKLIINVHGKDGVRPTEAGQMGIEKRLGDGQVDFPSLIKLLYDTGYRGPLTIEREISGPQQIKDIIHAKQILETIKKGLLKFKKEDIQK